jgi:hypothetical protein
MKIDITVNEEAGVSILIVCVSAVLGLGIWVFGK